MAKSKTLGKTSPRAKLKTLPEADREAIFHFSETNPIYKTIEFIRERFGVSTSHSSVSIFLAWHRLQRQSMDFSRDQDTLKDILKGVKPKLSPIELDQYAEGLFKIRAIQEMDARTYVDVTSHRRKMDLEEIKVHQKDREIALAEKRLALQIKQAEEAEKITRTPMSDEEKMAQIRQLFNIGVDPEDA